MGEEDKVPQNRSARLPSWAWIIIVPLVSWLALFLVLVFAGMVPLGALGAFGSASTTSSEPSSATDQSALVLKGHTASVKGVAFSPDSTMLASVGDEAQGRLKLWRVSNGALIYSIDAHKGGARCVAVSPDGKLLATGGQDGVVRLWNAADGTLVRELTGSVADQTAVAFSPDGRTLAASTWGRSWAGEVDTVHLWRVDDGAPLLRLNGNPRVATSITFSPDGQYLAAGGDDYQDSPGLYIWHLPDGKLVHSVNKMTSWAVKFSPRQTSENSGLMLAVGRGDIDLMSVPDGTVIRTLAYDGGSLGESMDFSPDSSLLVTGSWDNSVRLWRVSDGKELQTWHGHSTFVESVAFSPDGRLVASGSLDNTVRLWTVPTSTSSDLGK